MARRNTPITEAPPDLSARDVRALRDKLRVSQSVLATILNVSTELVQAWEGERRVPRGAALRLLELVKSRPELVLIADEKAAPRAKPTRKTPAKSRPKTRATPDRIAHRRTARRRPRGFTRTERRPTRLRQVRRVRHWLRHAGTPRTGS